MSRTGARRGKAQAPRSEEPAVGTTSGAREVPTLSLVIPVYNEVAHLGRWCQDLFAFDFGVPTEYVFVDDASVDGSREVLAPYANRPDVRVEFSDVNRGKGSALALAIPLTRGKIVVVQDADFEYSLGDVPALIEPILKDEADVVYGSRYRTSQIVHRTFHYAINRLLTLTSNFASGLYLSDMETCYKAFRGEIIRNMTLVSPRFGIEPELTAKVAALKARVAEVPVRYFPRGYLEGKKIRWTDGVAAMWHIARFNFDRKHLADSLEKVPEQFRLREREWL